MVNIPSITPKELCKVLEKRGFELKRINGSHHYYQHPTLGKNNRSTHAQKRPA